MALCQLKPLRTSRMVQHFCFDSLLFPLVTLSCDPQSHDTSPPLLFIQANCQPPRTTAALGPPERSARHCMARRSELSLPRRSVLSSTSHTRTRVLQLHSSVSNKYRGITRSFLPSFPLDSSFICTTRSRDLLGDFKGCRVLGW